MTDKVHCATHGECQATYVCTHLLGETSGLGFNRDDSDKSKLFPDAWCDACELIRAAHEGWNEESEKLTKISLLCSGCYERARIRNTRTSFNLDDLADLRWKCGSCEEWHTGPCLDFGYDAPHFWRKDYERGSRSDYLRPVSESGHRSTFLDEDYCAIEDSGFFLRGLIHVPIVGTAESLRWGVWGSLSREHFETLLKMDEDPNRVELPAMFSWLSTRIPKYPDTLNLKMYACIQKPGWRPHFDLEPTDHLLSQEYHKGITVERVRQIMMHQLHGV